MLFYLRTKNRFCILNGAFFLGEKYKIRRVDVGVSLVIRMIDPS